MPEDEKLFYSIGEAANLVNVKPYVLRYWESEFKKLNPQKSETGQRAYRKKDIQVALTIKRLLYDEQYTIAGANKKLEELEKDELDQLDIFGAKTPATGPLNGEGSSSQEGPTSPSPNQPEPNTAPEKMSYPAEKVQELKNLIASTRSLLQKYPQI